MKRLRIIIISILLVLSVYQLKGYIQEFRRIIQWEEYIETAGKEESISEELDLSHKEYKEELIGIQNNLNNEEISKLNNILENKDIIPEKVLELALTNPETIDFVYSYPNKNKYEDIEIKGEESIDLDRNIPMYLQWDTRWGYKNYGNSIIALSGCGPTSLSMVISGLRKDVQVTPDIMANISIEKGYITEENFTSWELMNNGGEEFGIISKEVVLDENRMKEEILKGNPLILSVKSGKMTDIGHILVLSGVDSNGEFIMNDPNSIKNSKKTWKFEEIEEDIRNIWSYSLK